MVIFVMRFNDRNPNWFSVIKVAKKPVAVKKTAKAFDKIEENKSKYGKRIKQLKVIINDLNYLSTGNTYREFIIDMSSALVHGRKITPKMESAITKIVKSYTKHLNEERDPKLRKQKLDYTDNTISKLNIIKRKLDECNYTKGYTNEKLYFLESIEKQVYSRGSLSIKQRKALNGMFKQFEKRILGIK